MREEPRRFADLVTARPEQLRQAAELLVDAFRDVSEAWPTADAAAAEVREALDPARVARMALGDEGDVLGWIAGAPIYGGRVWELHPLAVRPSLQRRGIGRALVLELERTVSEQGALTLFLGTDDEAGLTSLGGADLYPGVLERLRGLKSLRAHPSDFYARLGFEVVGVVPDANGFGKPDILMAKRVARGVHGGEMLRRFS